MTVEAAITAVLEVACPRVFKNFAPVLTARPYVTYQQIGGQVIRYTTAEVANLKNGEFQVNVWADTAKEAKEVIEAIEVGLVVASAFQAQPISAPIGGFDSDIPVHGYRQDFSIWSPR